MNTPAVTQMPHDLPESAQADQVGMNPEFEARIRKLEPAMQRLLNAEAFRIETIPGNPRLCGIYVFFASDVALYVGRSNNIGNRLRLHSRNSSSINQASFACRLAKKAIGLNSVPYSIRRDDPAHWARLPEFVTQFSLAKERVRQMRVRFAEEKDSVDQLLLEAYVATVLKTPHNDFDNH